METTTTEPATARVHDPAEGPQAALSECGVRPGSLWRHHRRGGVYEVVALSCRESDYAGLVTYRALDGRHHWTRPLTEWGEVVAPGVTRFLPVAGPLVGRAADLPAVLAWLAAAAEGLDHWVRVLDAEAYMGCPVAAQAAAGLGRLRDGARAFLPAPREGGGA